MGERISADYLNPLPHISQIPPPAHRIIQQFYRVPRKRHHHSLRHRCSQRHPNMTESLPYSEDICWFGVERGVGDSVVGGGIGRR